LDRLKDCQVCQARKDKRPEPHRAHHARCPKNRFTRRLPAAAAAAERLAIELEQGNHAPSLEEERLSSRATAEEVHHFFRNRRGEAIVIGETNNMASTGPATSVFATVTSIIATVGNQPTGNRALLSLLPCNLVTADEIYRGVVSRLTDPENSGKCVPVAMPAFAAFVSKETLNAKKHKAEKFNSIFVDIAVAVPRLEGKNNAFYDSIMVRSFMLLTGRELFLT
jgi:hypothetical protein